jgi:hypothetical protein
MPFYQELRPHKPVGTFAQIWTQKGKNADCVDMKKRIEVTRRRGRRRKQLLDDLGYRRGYSDLKEEALDRIKWRNRFGRGCGPVV